MKKIQYNYEDISEIIKILNTMSVSGATSVKSLAKVFTTLEKGVVKETPENKENKDDSERDIL